MFTDNGTSMAFQELSSSPQSFYDNRYNKVW